MRTAVIVFLKYPEPGHVKTRLAADLSAEAAAELYSDLSERLITEIYPLEGSYDVFLYVDPTHGIDQYRAWIGDTWTFRAQQGFDLGARMSHAVMATFDEGYEAAILLGSDCIGLDEPMLADAFASLDNHDLVLGPSNDGGYYLLGLREHFSWLFENMEWSTEHVLETTLDRAEALSLEVRQLDTKTDVDTLEDLEALRRELPEEHFIAKKIDRLILESLGAGGEPETSLSGDYHTTHLRVALEGAGGALPLEMTAPPEPNDDADPSSEA